MVSGIKLVHESRVKEIVSTSVGVFDFIVSPSSVLL